jgi:hypothetical protein
MNRYLIALLILVLSGCASKYEKLYNQKPAFYSYIAGNVDDRKNKLSDALVFEQIHLDTYTHLALKSLF